MKDDMSGQSPVSKWPMRGQVGDFDGVDDYTSFGDFEDIALFSRAAGKSYMNKVFTAWGYNPFHLGEIGGHTVKRQKKNDGRQYKCLDCDWSACHPTDDLPDEKCRVLEACVYGDALETECEET